MPISITREASPELIAMQKNDISKIPVELLGDIFSHVVSHPTPNIFELGSQSRAELGWELIRTVHSLSYASCASPYAISHVCGHWREIALSSSHLWTPLRVVLPVHKHVLPLLKLWIERAKDRPVELSIQEDPVQSANDRQENSRQLETSRVVFDLFLSLIERWKSIDISLSYTPLEHLIHPTVLSSLFSSHIIPHHLESIRISTSPTPEEDPGSGLGSRQRSQGRRAVLLFASLLHRSPYLREVTWGHLDLVTDFEPALHAHSSHRLSEDPTSESYSPTSSLWPASLLELTIHQVHCEDITALFTSLSSGCPALRKLCIRRSEQPRWPYSSNSPPPPASSLLSSPWDTTSQQSTARGHVDGRLLSRPSKILLQILDTLLLAAFEDRELPAIFDAVELPSLSTLCLSSTSNSTQNLDGTNPSSSASNTTSSSKDTFSARNGQRWSRLSAWAWCSLSSMLQRSDARLEVLEVGGVDLCGCPYEAGEIWQPYWR